MSLGEVKWGQVMERAHLERLARARELQGASFDTADCGLACYSAAGFHGDLLGKAVRTARPHRL